MRRVGGSVLGQLAAELWAKNFQLWHGFWPIINVYSPKYKPTVLCLTNRNLTPNYSLPAPTRTRLNKHVGNILAFKPVWYLFPPVFGSTLSNRDMLMATPVQFLLVLDPQSFRSRQHCSMARYYRMKVPLSVVPSLRTELGSFSETSTTTTTTTVMLLKLNEKKSTFRACLLSRSQVHRSMGQETTTGAKRRAAETAQTGRGGSRRGTAEGVHVCVHICIQVYSLFKSYSSTKLKQM